MASIYSQILIKLHFLQSIQPSDFIENVDLYLIIK